MFQGTVNMKSLSMLEMGMNTATMRRDVIANNIANVDVPHFKRSEVAFEANMKRAIDSQKREASEPQLMTIHPEHIAGRRGVALSSVRPVVHIDYNSTMRNDGNNVDIEDEVSKMVRNQMLYNLMADQVGREFRTLNQLTRLA